MVTDKQLENLRQTLAQAKSIVFFGGAGVSTESGLPDFRSANGLYRQKFAFPPEVMLSHNFFFSHTREFFDFYKAIILNLEARPNAAHFKLAGLEAAGLLAAVITQNIDGLHQAAGSRTVLELHGSVHRNYCLRCQAFYDAATVAQAAGIPYCGCGGLIKPDVVLYEEGLDQAVFAAASAQLRQADVLIVGGTSLAVYPAASLVRHFRGNHLILINKEASSLDSEATLILRGPIGEILAQVEG